MPKFNVNEALGGKALFHLGFGVDSTIEYSPVHQGGLLRSVFGFLDRAKLAHRTLNLAPKAVMLADQSILSMVL